MTTAMETESIRAELAKAELELEWLKKPVNVAARLLGLLQEAQAEDDRYVGPCLLMAGIVHTLREIPEPEATA